MSTMENGNLNRNSGTPRTPLTHAQKYIRQQQQLKQQQHQHQQPQNSLYSSPTSQLPPNAQERQQPQMGQTKIKGSQPHPTVYENGHPLNNNGNHHHQHQHQQPQQQIYENVNLQQQHNQQQPQTQQRNSQQLLQNQNHPQPKLDRNSSPLQSAPQRQLHHHPQQQQQQQQQRPQQQQPPLTQQQKQQQQQQHLLPPLEPLPFEDDDTPPSSPPGRPKSRSSEPGLIPATPHLRRRLTRRMKYTPARYKDEEEYIGFATLPEQVHRKAVRKGFDFTLMVVGESGLGKSTLINSLFLSELYKDRDPVGVNDLIQRTVNIEKKQIEIEEKGVRLKLTIVDTPGFNDTVNADNCHKTLIDYVDEQFKQFYDDESGLNRRNIVDNRVHCCLYFISPYGHGLKPIDVETMKKLHHKVNIVPLLAKSDILTKQEIKRMKDRILKEVEEHEIRIYQFPDCDSDEDDDFKQQDRELKASIPFAVVGCNTVVEAGGKKIRGRAYPWGIVEVDNPNHCDFVRLRQMLISTHMQDLKDITSDVHYENYRAVHIRSQMGSTQKERSKLKRDSAPNIEAVADAEKLLEAKDAEIQRMQKMLAQMQAQLTGGKQNGV